MAFRMRSEADDWFRGIVASDGPIRTKFDQYYLCLMLGFATGRNERAQSAPDFVDYFVADYAAVGRLLVALLVIAEAERLGVELGEKGDMKKLLDEYLDPKHPANLTEIGFQKLNDYANGGFNVLVESIPERPRHVDPFLQAYSMALHARMTEGKQWTKYQ